MSGFRCGVGNVSGRLRRYAALTTQNGEDMSFLIGKISKFSGWTNEGEGTYLEVAEFSTSSFT
jgi:hypothetical protein